MDTAIILRSALLLTITLIASSAYGDNCPSIDNCTRAQAIKNYSVARCIYRSFNDKEIKNDAAETAAAYLQFNVNISEAEKIDNLISDLLKQPAYASGSGGNFYLMRCIDFMNSKQVQSVVDSR